MFGDVIIAIIAIIAEAGLLNVKPEVIPKGIPGFQDVVNVL